MALSKLTITACKSVKGTVSELSSPPPFKVMINPDSYTISSSIDYVKDESLGQPNQEARFKGIVADQITLNPIILDGTGAVAGAPEATVAEQMEHLRKVACAFNGTEHEAPVVKLAWGTFVYHARLEKMSANYTLFSPEGEPLRAKVTLNFVEYKSVKEIQSEARKSSPDLTHFVDVKDGDTLALLCHRIYKDVSYAPQIARFNGLTSFRELVPGTVLTFPPLAG